MKVKTSRTKSSYVERRTTTISDRNMCKGLRAKGPGWMWNRDWGELSHTRGPHWTSCPAFMPWRTLYNLGKLSHTTCSSWDVSKQHAPAAGQCVPIETCPPCAPSWSPEPPQKRSGYPAGHTRGSDAPANTTWRRTAQASPLPRTMTNNDVLLFTFKGWEQNWDNSKAAVQKGECSTQRDWRGMRAWDLQAILKTSGLYSDSNALRK